jgi:WD40 repeat protein
LIAFNAQRTAQDEANQRATAVYEVENEAMARATAQAIAEAERRLAVARELAMSANANLEVDPELSALLAMQSISTTLTLEGVNALHRAMPELHTEKAYYFEGAQGEGAAISPDGTRLVLTTINGDLIVVDISSGETLYKVTPQEELIPGTLKYSPDGSKIATSGPTAKADLTLYDADTGEVIHSWVSQQGAPMYIENVGGDIAFSPDGTRLAVANFNGYPHVMDVQSGEIILKLEGHQLVANGLAYSPDGSMIATGDESVGEVIVWSSSDGSQIRSFQGGESGIYAIAFSPDSERLSAVGDDGLLNIWAIDSGETILSQPSGTSGYRAVVFTPDGKNVITGGQDTTVRVWDANTGEQLQKIAGTGSIVSHISLSPDGKYFATTIGTDHYARLWSLEPGTELYTLPGNSFAIGMLFSTNGEVLITAGKDGVINTWDPETGAPLGDFLRLPVDEGTIIGNLQYSPDRESIAAAHGPFTSLIDLDSKELTQTFEGHIGPVIDVAFSPDGDQMISVGFDGKAIVFDTNTGEMTTEYLEHGQWALGAAYTPDGDYVTTAGTGNAVFIWDPNTGETVNTLPVQSILTALEFSPDGKWLVVGDADGRMFIWDAETLEFYKEIQAHDSWITEIAFSQDGTRMGTAAFDTLGKVWEVPSFTEMGTLYGSKMNGGGIEFSPDGRVVVAGFWDETYRGYLVDPEDLIQFARSRLIRSLTDVECQKFLHLDSCP